MEKQPIDKHFQDKLANREFNFQDSYWKEAEAMIEAAERDKRRRIFGWLFGVGFLFVLAGVSWWLMSNAEVERVAINNNLQQPTVINQPKENQETNFSQSMTDENALSDKVEMPDENNIRNEQNFSVKNDNIPDPTKNLSIAEKEKITNQQLIEKSADKPLRTVVENDINSYKSDDYVIVSKKEAINQNLPDNGLEVVPSLTQSDDELLKNPSATSNQQILKALPGLFPYLEQEFSLNLNLKDLEIYLPENPNPPNNHRWNMKILAGTGVLINPQANDKSLVNYFVGGAIGYKISPKIGLQSGLIYNIHQANFARTEGSRQISYGFGKQDNTYEWQAQQLHFVELPVAIGYHYRKSQFSVGFQLGKLIGARGAVIENISKNALERTEQENQNFEQKIIEARANGDQMPVFREEMNREKGWLPTDHYRPLQFSLVGKYEFVASPKFNLGMALNYRLNSNYLKNGTGQHSPFSVQFYTSYRIFN